VGAIIMGVTTTAVAEPMKNPRITNVLVSINKIIPGKGAQIPYPGVNLWKKPSFHKKLIIF